MGSSGAPIPCQPNSRMSPFWHQVAGGGEEVIRRFHGWSGAGANSTSKCDISPTQPEPILSTPKDGLRLLEAKAFPRSQVQPPFYPGYKLIADRSHIGSLRDVLPEQLR